MAVSRVEKVEVITHVERRRRFAENEKLRFVAESFASGSSVAAVAKRHGLSQGLIFGWRRAVRDGRLGRDAVPVALADASAVAPFIRINASAPEPATIRVTFPNGVILDLPALLEPARVAALMQAIHGPR